MSVKVPGGVRFGSEKNPSPVGENSKAYEPALDFVRDEFTANIKAKGYPVVWEKAAFCPNRKGLGDSDHSLNCALCLQTGFIYFDPIETVMLATNIKLSESYFAYGRWDNGTVSITALPEMQISDWDRITFTEGCNRFNEMVYRVKTGDSDVLKYSALSVLYVVWAKRGVQYTGAQGTDFTVAGNSLTWIGTNRPYPGDLYVVVYTHRPKFIVTDLLHQIRLSQLKGVMIEYPVQVMAKLEYLIRNEGKDEGKGPDPSPFPES